MPFQSFLRLCRLDPGELVLPLLNFSILNQMVQLYHRIFTSLDTFSYTSITLNSLGQAVDTLEKLLH